MRLLATTNRGLEDVAVGEIDDLIGATASAHHPGWIAFEAPADAIGTLNRRSRTLHRVLVELVDATATDLDEVAALTEAVPFDRYVDAEQAFAVESTRIGTHSFGSPDVSDVVGQAVIDSFRERTGQRLPVDLDDPDVTLQATVRHDRFTLALDTTGPVSLHRRPYRVCDHPAPIRPTLAVALLELVGFGRDESLADPLCGGATIPIEAALAARGRSPNADRTAFAFRDLSFVPEVDESVRDSGRDTVAPIAGGDGDPEWLDCARENVTAVDTPVDLYRGDATSFVPDVDVIATDLPFGIRQDHDDLRPLYRDFVTAVEAVSPVRFVALTTKPHLLPVEADEERKFRDGRLDVSIVVASL